MRSGDARSSVELMREVRATFAHGVTFAAQRCLTYGDPAQSITKCGNNAAHGSYCNKSTRRSRQSQEFRLLPLISLESLMEELGGVLCVYLGGVVRRWNRCW